MDLRVLGCSGGRGRRTRLTGLLVNGVLAIDAGSFPTQALTVQEQTGPRQIFISHSHLDHICSLPFFTKNIFGHTEVPVEIRARATLDALRRHLFNDELCPGNATVPQSQGTTIFHEGLVIDFFGSPAEVVIFPTRPAARAKPLASCCWIPGGSW